MLCSLVGAALLSPCLSPLVLQSLPVLKDKINHNGIHDDLESRIT